MLCARVRNRMLLAPVNFPSCKGYIAITRTVNGLAASLPLLGMIYRGVGALITYQWMSGRFGGRVPPVAYMTRASPWQQASLTTSHW